MSDSTIKRSALLIATFSSFLTPFMVSSINIALPAIGSEFQMSAVLMSWVPTSYILSAAMFLVPFGRLADIHGRKRVFAYGMWIFTLSSLALAFSPSAAVLITLRVLQGFGSAMIFGTGMAILTSVFPAAERGRVLGINVAAVYLGLSLGPVFGGFPDPSVRVAEHLPGECAARTVRDLSGRCEAEEGVGRGTGRSVRCCRFSFLCLYPGRAYLRAFAPALDVPAYGSFLPAWPGACSSFAGIKGRRAPS